MSNASPARAETRLQDVESVITAIKAQVKLLDCLVMVDVIDPEISGVITTDDETYREILPLGDGVHLVISLGPLPTQLGLGLHEIDV